MYIYTYIICGLYIYIYTFKRFIWILHGFNLVYNTYNWLLTSIINIDDVHIETSMYRGSPIATFYYQRVDFINREENSSQLETQLMWQLQLLVVGYSYGHLSVISTYNPIYRMYNPIEITSYNW